MDIRPYPKDPRYGVTEDGRVFRIVRARFGRPVPYELTPVLGENGYLYVGSGNKAGGLRITTLHRMVAETFIPNPEGLPEVAHDNGVRHDCRKENLRWDTRQGNFADRVRHGTAWLGSIHAQAKLMECQVQFIRGCAWSAEHVARHFGLSLSHAKRLKSGEGWSHV